MASGVVCGLRRRRMCGRGKMEGYSKWWQEKGVCPRVPVERGGQAVAAWWRGTGPVVAWGGGSTRGMDGGEHAYSASNPCEASGGIMEGQVVAGTTFQGST